MAQFRITVGGVVVGVIDNPDLFSKDPGANVLPQAAPNTPVNTGGSKSTVVNFNSTNGSGQITSVLNNPG